MSARSGPRHPPPHPSAGNAPVVDWLANLRPMADLRTAPARIRAWSANLGPAGTVSLAATLLLVVAVAVGPWLTVRFLGDSPALMAARRFLHLLPDQSPPGTAEVPTVWLTAYALLLFVPLYALHLDRNRRCRRRPGCLGLVVAFVVQLPIFAYLSTIVALPALALMYTGVPGTLDDPGALDQPGGLSWTVVSPVVALAIAWWYRPPWRLGARRLLLRAVLLLFACATALVLVQMGGLTLFGPAGTLRAIGVASGAVLVCVCSWWLADRERPAVLAVSAGLSFAMAVGVERWADTNRTSAAWDLGAASGSGLLASLVVAALVAFGLLQSIAAIRRVRQRLWRRLRPRRAGQVWEAFVPFEQDEESGKYRPVLVLRTFPDRAHVMPITSKHKPHRSHERIHLPLEEWQGTLSKESWLQLTVMELPASYFHHYRGRCRRTLWERLGPTIDQPTDPTLIRQRRGNADHLDL